MLRRVVALFLIDITVLSPTFSWAAPPKIPGFYGAIPNTTTPITLPVPLPGGVQQGVASITTVGTNHLVIDQNAPQAIIDWKSFNIGANAWTQFNQQGNKNWVALNRIYDQNPTQIYGKLTADGKIYLINQNGILFGPGSQVNVHSLVASSLAITDADFLAGILKFQAPAGSTPGVVSNHGAITTDELGSVFLIGSQVENYGSINAPVGQIGLAAGTDVELSSDPSGVRSALIVNVKDGAGSATNGEGASMIADTGLVGMYGQEVTQNGLIRSVTALRKNGQIELLASDKVVLGADSVTATPITDSSETVDASFAFSGGKITVGGLDPAHPALSQVPAKQIELYGTVQAPGGTVTMQADQRIFLDQGSSISVAGSWCDLPASADAASATLNSVTLNNDYGQKGGVLQGQTVTVDPAAGSNIGNVQASLAGGDKTALERSTQGGSINLQVASGDLIAKQGALLDFSGGGINYGLGAYAGTKLLSGNTVYDLSTAPEWVTYSTVLGDQVTKTNHFGKTGEYVGLYFGGGSGVLDLKPGFSQGADAGSLSVSAPHVVLDAKLNGAATAGVYQTVTTGSAAALAAGTETPQGGSLTIGAAYSGPASDLVVDSLVVKGNVAATTGSADSIPIAPTAPTVISSKTLSEGGLGSISLYANSGLTIASDAAVTLGRGGSFTANSRAIDDQGSIAIPGGKVTLTTSDNVTSSSQSSRYKNVSQNLIMESGSSIDVAGEQIDNSLTGKGAGVGLATGITSGGSISLQDLTVGGNDVIVQAGASLNVNGGYAIDAKGKVTGGNAGALDIEGHSVVLEGTLSGLSLPGSQGGTLTLHADEIDVVAGTPPTLDPKDVSQITSDRLGKAVLGQQQIDNSGFSQLVLNSENDIFFHTKFSPSTAKLSAPFTAQGESTGQLAVNASLFGGDPLSPDYLGTTSVSASTGVLFPKPANFMNSSNSHVWVDPGAGISVTPTGSITLQSNSVEMLGTLTAHSGQVNLTATTGDVTLASAAQGSYGTIDASGYLKPASTLLVSGVSVDATPLAGGSVTLSAAGGSLNLVANDPVNHASYISTVNVSGSAPATRQVSNADGTLSSVVVASDAGSLTLNYGNSLSLGTINGLGNVAGAKGGTLSLSSGQDLTVTTTCNQNIVNDPSQVNKVVYLDLLTGSGFDAVTLKSATALDLAGAINAQTGRSLTLDAPVIKGDGSSQTLWSPWTTIQNSTVGANPAAGNGAAGSGTLRVGGDWLDLKGAVQLSGFSSVALAAQDDLRLTDLQYGPNKNWQGALALTGDLSMTAQRIYPTTLADFTVNVASYQDGNGKSAGGNVALLPNGTNSPETILSAGGKLTVKAAGNIEVSGELDASMGQIELDAPNGRVYLDGKSVLSTAGSAAVPFGLLDDVFWSYLDRSSANNVASMVSAAPQKSVTINGQEVITRAGSTIDVSGGGSIFGYQFIPGTQGSVDPFTVKGRYIIVPDGSVSLPGTAVYLTGGNGIKAGVYSILPEQYAFLPGALVLTNLGTVASAVGSQSSPEGYPVVTGFLTENGSRVSSPLMNNFSVRSAADVQKEGHFATATLTAGDAGAVTLHGATTIIDGDLKAAALAGYQGGSLDLSGKNVTVGSAGSAALPADFGFQSAVPADQVGTLQLSASSVSGKGLQRLNLGDQGTATVTVGAGSTLDVQNLSLSAQNSITIGAGATVEANAPKGESATVTLSAPSGSVAIGTGALVHGASSVAIDTDALDLKGTVTTAPGGLLQLTSDGISLVGDGSSATGAGLALNSATWSQFSGFSDLALQSRSDLVFQGDFNLQVAGRLSMDAARLVGTPGSAGSAVTAQSMVLQNSGAASSAALAGASSGSLTLTADQVTLGGGDLQVAGFGKLNVNSAHDLTCQGDGSLQVAGDLRLSAARITAAPGTNSSGDGSPSYVPANFTVTAANGTVSIGNSGQGAGTSSSVGGTLNINAQGVVIDGGVIELPSGVVNIATGNTGNDQGIVLRNGASILAKGSSTPTADPQVSDYLPGGSVTLSSASAAISIEKGSSVDVSAAGTGDAGSVTLQASQGGVSVAGSLNGQASGGKGGSLTLSTDSLDTVGGVNRFSALAGTLSAGGFNGDLELRSATGNVTIDQPAQGGAAVSADNFKLTADGGSILLNGTIDVSGQGQGGSATLLAGKSLVLAAGSALLAKGQGSGASGGEVLLGIAAGSSGTLQMASGATVDVTGNGGTVTFRAPQQNDTQVALALNGTVSGASRVVADAVHAVDLSGQGTVTGADLAKWNTAAASFLQNVSWQSGLKLDPGVQLTLIPGTEAASSGNLSVSSLDLTSARFGSVAGELTLRAAGNLTVNGSVSDRGAGPGWDINLVAGADRGSADFMAVNNGKQGTLTVASGAAVYTKTGDLSFASGGDTTLNQAAAGFPLPLSLGTDSGALRGRVGGDLLLNGGVIQSASGDIDLKVGGDLYLKTASTTMGSIRTTGSFQADPSQYWNYSQGGGISLAVKGSVQGGLDPNQWDYENDVNGDGSLYVWSAAYQQDGALPTAGIATLAGGDLSIRTGGSFAGQSGTFGAGNLSLFAGGDIKNAHFLVKDGSGTLSSLGNIGNFGASNYLVLDAFNARLNLAAQGEIQLGTVLEPTLVREVRPGETVPWNLLYAVGSSADTVSSLKLSAANGDVTIYGSQQNGDFVPAAALLPPDLQVYAGGNINLWAPQLILAPSPYGNLKLRAGNSILGGETSPSYLYVSDLDPQSVYGEHPDFYVGELTTAHSATPVHQGDPNPVTITAEKGDIEDLQLHLPKAAQIVAGGDIKDIYYSGQNLSAGDVSEIVAGGNITFSNKPGQAAGNTGIDQAGPGTLLVEAGDSIDLGTTKGIKSNGNFIDGTANRALGNDGAALVIVAGTTGSAQALADPKLEVERVAGFFKGSADGTSEGLQQYGVDYSTELSKGESGAAEATIAQARDKVITPFFGGADNTGTGNLRMTSSQISTVSGQDDISIVARGQIDVGKSTFNQNTQSTGIFTAGGGAINAFSGGDLNVNESRLMTFLGGDITLWSDQGNINAGRGSRTTISASPPKLVEQSDGSYLLVFQPPAVGSGIRAVTFDPDGVEGPLTAPPAGNLYISAPNGIIDAGEAGMAGNKAFMGARAVANASNMSFSGASVGVPATSEGTVSIGALGGAGAVSAAAGSLEQSQQLAQQGTRLNPGADLAEDFIAKWLDVKVLGFDDETTQQNKSDR